MSYQTLDAIADAYVPALLLIIVLSIASNFTHPRVALKALCTVVLLAMIAYGVMFADSALGIWAKHGWDYSTHTATSAACVWYLFWLHKQGRLWGGFFHSTAVKAIWPTSFLLYLCLMRYQNYHSWADMLTTLVAVFPLFWVHYFATR